MSDITIVTAFFDIGRGKLPKTKFGRELPFYQHRSVDTYFEFFKNLAKAKNDMVIYTSPEYAEKVYDIRDSYGLKDKTTVVVMESYMPKGLESYKERTEKVMQSEEYLNRIQRPELIEYWHADYVLVNIFKSLYVNHAIENGYVKDDVTAWIDFGYCRDANRIPEHGHWTYNFNPEKIHFFNIQPIQAERPIDEIISTGDVYIMGCHMIAGTKMWTRVRELVFGNLEVLLNHNLSDDDQTLLLMSYLTKPEEFELRFVDPSDWFIIFKNYNDYSSISENT